MASGGHRYTLVGFSQEIDRRPLFFVEPLPATKVCSACGVVPNKVAFLPCGHIFCKPCNQQFKRDGRFACPLDEDVCSDEEIVWINHPARSIMGKQVLCWNQVFGCRVVTAASDISRHFHHDCMHHLVECTKCGTQIIASDMCAHLDSQCGPSSSANAVLPRQTVSQEAPEVSLSHAIEVLQRIVSANSVAMSSIKAQLNKVSHVLSIGDSSTMPYLATGERTALTRLLQETLSEMKIQMTAGRDHIDEVMQTVTANLQTFQNVLTEKHVELIENLHGPSHSGSQSDQSACLTTFRKATLDWHRETKAELDRLSAASGLQCHEIGELSRNINALNKTVNKILLQTSKRDTHTMARSASRICATSGNSEARRNSFSDILSAVFFGTKRQWVLTGYASLKAKKHITYDFAGRKESAVYLRGYRVSLGACIAQRGVKFSFQLHKGKIDEFLEWPFQLRMKFSILHPQTAEELQHCVAPNVRGGACYSRPLELENPPVFIVSDSFECGKLESRGFIQNDRILLSFSIQDDNAATN